jgi:ribonucleotide monophosphatase NagD (HAD superfamily)
VLAGKPSAEFYRQVLASLGDGITAADVIMVGDDIISDVGGAQGAGLHGWLVRTGKFREATLSTSGVTPDRIIGSIAEVAG